MTLHAANAGRRSAEGVFMQMLDTPAQERAAVLDRLCAGDEALRADVAALLRFHDQDQGLLDAPPLVGSLSRLANGDHDDSLTPGTRLGEYTIQRTLGEGGMGAVYVALQERPSRTVAIKVIRRGLASASLVRRFEHEAEVLGRLQHPGIAQIYEAGAAPISGLEARGPVPFIAMELIDGQRLTEFATDLPLREKLALMAKVCAAVHHAHQRGVIHRDLKPANILVDRSGQPKVLDFGVARAADADLRVTTLATGVGQLIGTLPYMSPEQVLADPASIDIRSDVYSLGVILYQILTGRLPHDLSSRSIPEAARVIRDEEPTKLSSVSRVFRGDVDTIVAKSIEKDPARRYQSAAELADDLERHLRGEPIAARGDSPLYVLRKQLRRYRLAVAATGILAGLVVTFAVYASVQASQSREQAIRERGLKEKADETAGRLAEELSISTIERARLLIASQNGWAAGRLLWPEFLERPDSRPALWALRSLYAASPNLATLPQRAYSLVAPAYSPEGSLVALAAGDRVEVHQGDLSRAVMTLSPGGSSVSAIAFSPDSHWLAAGDDKGAVSFMEVKSGGIVRTAKRHSDTVQAIAFASDGTHAATGGGDGKVLLWDLAAGEVTRTVRTAGDRVTVLRFSADGTQLIVGERSGNLERWALLAETPAVRTGSSFYVTSLDFSPDGTRLYTTSSGGMIWARDPMTLEQSAAIKSGLNIIRTASLSQDGEVLLLCGDGGIEQWNTKTMTLSHAMVETSGRYYGTLRPGREGFATVGFHSIAQYWERTPGLSTKTLLSIPNPPRSTFFHDGVLINTGTSASTAIRKLSLTTPGEGETIVDDLPGIISITASPDESEIAATLRDGRVCAWSSVGVLLRETRTPVTATAITWVADQTYVVLAGGKTYIWNGPSAELRPLDAVPTDRVFAAHRPGTAQVAFVGRSPNLAVFDVGTGKFVKEYTRGSRQFYTRYSHDGTMLLASAADRSVEILDAETLEVKSRLVGMTATLFGGSFSPDDQLVTTAGSDGHVYVWEVGSGRLLATPDSDRKAMHVAEFSRDGHWLLSTGESGQVRVTDLTYYDRHIAGNLDFQKEWQRTYAGRVWEVPKLDLWARGILERSPDPTGLPARARPFPASDR